MEGGATVTDMTPRPQAFARWSEVLIAALLLGIAGDALLRPLPWGIGAGLWIGLVLAGLGIMARRAGICPTREIWWPAGAGLFFALALAWRDAGFLQVLNVFMLLVMLAITFARLRQTALARMGIADLTADLIRMAMAGLSGVVPILAEDVRATAPTLQPGAKRAAVAVLRGLLMAIPLLLLFGALLGAADPVFARLATGWLPERFGDHIWLSILVIAVLAWGLAGVFREALGGRPWALPEPGAVRRSYIGALELGPIELWMIVGGLNALFLAFVIIQFRYLFAGADVIGVGGLWMTHAQYARQGFFELLFVTALVLPVLLLVHWLTSPDHPLAGRVYRALAGVMVGLVGVMMVSALYRMWLYVERFGLTSSRLYALAVMAGLALVLAWFCATVLWRRRERFAVGALAAAVVVIVLLNVLSPDALVARVNIGRWAAGHPLDAVYLTTLSADAAPVVLYSLEELDFDREDQMFLARNAFTRWGPYRPADDWRTGNWGRAGARRAVKDHREMLQRLLPPF